MIGKTRQHRDLMSISRPMAGELGGARSGGSHCWRKILRNIEDFHRSLVVAELKCALIAERPSAFAGVTRIALPAICVMRKDFIAREAVHYAKLNDVQAMVKRAGQHRQAGARLLVKGPEPKIVRSEERRVGKECRSRWSPDQGKRQ